MELSLCMGEAASVIQPCDDWADSGTTGRLESLALKMLTASSFASRRRLSTSMRRFRLTVCTFAMTCQFASAFALLEMTSFLGSETSAACII